MTKVTAFRNHPQAGPTSRHRRGNYLWNQGFCLIKRRRQQDSLLYLRVLENDGLLRGWMQVKRLLGHVLMLTVFLGTTMSRAAEQFITLDTDTTIKVFLFSPEDAGSAPWPLAVILPGGQGHEYTARSQFWLGKELSKRGWIIAMPVSPDRGSFFGDSARIIARVISALQSQNPSMREGKSLLVGVSTGGSSALEIAALNPQNYLGVVAVPGRLRESTDLSDLSGLPVFLRIAEKDAFRWHKRMPDMVRQLEAAGARVNAALVPDARHTFRINWDELDQWLGSLEP